MKHEGSRNAHFSAEKTVKIICRQICRRNGSVERNVSSSNDDVVETRIDLVMKGVDDNAACTYCSVHQFAAVCRIDIVKLDFQWRWWFSVPDANEVINVGGAVANEVWHTMPSDLENVAGRDAPSVGKSQPNGARIIFEDEAIHGDP